jgi:elongation factor P hydroxylase
MNTASDVAKVGRAVIVAGLVLSAALVFIGLSQRYEVSTAMHEYSHRVVRIDRLTGTVDFCYPYEVAGLVDGKELRTVSYECSAVRAPR